MKTVYRTFRPVTNKNKKMVRESDIRNARYEMYELRRKFEDLENLVDYADTLEVDTATDSRVGDRHQQFVDDLTELYLELEDILNQADVIEDDDGKTVRELPGNVPDFVRERANNRPDVPGRDGPANPP